MKKTALLIAAALMLTTGCGETTHKASVASSDEVPDSTEAVPTEAITEETAEKTEAVTESPTESYPQLLSSADELNFTDITGCGESYTFTYGGEVYEVSYWTDNWRIIDSYKIRNENDITLICTVLAENHPIHSADYSEYRTPGDMAYEWIQHNIAYDMAPEGSSYKHSAKDVDIDPKDQGKSVYDLLVDRLDLGSLLEE